MHDNYPTYFMELESVNANRVAFFNDPFDKSITYPKKPSKRFFKLAKPKCVTKGGRGIHQNITVDESKLSHVKI